MLRTYFRNTFISPRTDFTCISEIITIVPPEKFAGTLSRDEKSLTPEDDGRQLNVYYQYMMMYLIDRNIIHRAMTYHTVTGISI